MKLKKGQKYEVGMLELMGWTGEHEGYDFLAYFEDGVYLGPDRYGVEPLFQEAV